MKSKNGLFEKLGKIQTRAELADFVSELRKDFLDNQESWENPDIPSFLSAMSAWIESMDGYYRNKGETLSEDQPWRIIAEILYAAKVYE